MSWYIVAICAGVVCVFAGFVFGALLGLWVMGGDAPEDCPAAQARKPEREEPTEPEGELKKRAAGEPAKHAPESSEAPGAAMNTMNTGNTVPAASAAGEEERPRE